MIGRALRVISYNLHEGRARSELLELATAHDVDALCLQECDTALLPDEVAGLRLAGATQRNRLGLALYYRPERLHLQGFATVPLRRSMHDRFLSPAHERLLAVRVVDDAGGGIPFTLASIHTAPLSATNAMRRSQIAGALHAIRETAHGTSALVVGDFNYPWFHSSLGRHLQQHGYEVSRSDLPTYVRRRFRGHFDFAISEGMQVDRVSTLAQGGSDHLPILVEARIGRAEVPEGAAPVVPVAGARVRRGGLPLAAGSRRRSGLSRAG
ncbi:endonuclease/exonuclease/phosphatase family protein [Kineococcus gynurae]|uniref:Endonuclease/exonuclease/phosphatase family protein n=1 Tax=Kineococcus gynurae TaxID=452979 RepID=A0ABV5LWU1_9ACTN